MFLFNIFIILVKLLQYTTKYPYLVENITHFFNPTKISTRLISIESQPKKIVVVVVVVIGVIIVVHIVFVVLPVVDPRNQLLKLG